MSVIPYGRQQITDEDIATVVNVLKSDYLTQGPWIEIFEKEICAKVGCKYAVAVANGTAALHLASLALGVKPGTKVLCTANSFAASSNGVLYCGGDVDFVDIDLRSYCIDLDQLEKKLAASPKKYSGIVAVDFAGLPADWPRLRKIADQYGVWLLEDACHAIGGGYLDEKGKPTWNCGDGKYADCAVFSFHPVKHVATGEGGLITTNSEELYEKLKMLRTHGITKDPKKMARNDGPWFMEMQELGYNYRIPDILCALGASQVKRLDANVARRREIAAQYQEALSDIKEIKLPQVKKFEGHAYHLFVILAEKRKELLEYLHSQKILAQVHYIPIYQHPYYVKRYGKQHFENCENYYKQTISIPMYHSLLDADIAIVCEKIRKFYRG